MNVRAKRAAVFTVITLFVSWLAVAVFLLCGGVWSAPTALIFSVAYMFVPMTVAILLQKLVLREPVRRPLGVSFRPNYWFLVAWLLPIVISFATLGVSLLLPGIRFAPGAEGYLEQIGNAVPPAEFANIRSQMPGGLTLLMLSIAAGLVAGPTINAIAAFGEELGWRGFLLRELRHMGFWSASLIVGAIWGVWHAPLILLGHNYPEHPVTGVAMMAAFCVLWAPLFSYVRLRARSVIAAAILHGSLNALAGIAVLFAIGGNDLTVGVTGLAGFAVLIVVNIGIWIHDRYVADKPVGEVLAAMQ